MIPEGLVPGGFDWMVAGGWAVCPALASDKDVFVLIDRNTDDSESVRALILAGLKNYGFDFEEEGGIEEEIHRLQYGALVLRVAKVDYHGQTLHVLIGLGPNPEDILNTFDLSICQIGIMSDGTLVRGDDVTPISAPIKIVRDTPTTAARLAKYQQRFNITWAVREEEIGENI